MRAVIYDQSGLIIRRINASTAAVALQCGTGEAWIEGEGSDLTHYVNLDGEPTITAKGNYTLDALPLPCTVTIEGEVYACTEQPVFDFNYPGTYTISVDAGIRFLEKEFDYDHQP